MNTGWLWSGVWLEVLCIARLIADPRSFQTLLVQAPPNLVQKLRARILTPDERRRSSILTRQLQSQPDGRMKEPYQSRVLTSQSQTQPREDSQMSESETEVLMQDRRQSLIPTSEMKLDLSQTESLGTVQGRTAAISSERFNRFASLKQQHVTWEKTLPTDSLRLSVRYPRLSSTLHPIVTFIEVINIIQRTYTLEHGQLLDKSAPVSSLVVKNPKISAVESATNYAEPFKILQRSSRIDRTVSLNQCLLIDDIETPKTWARISILYRSEYLSSNDDITTAKVVLRTPLEKHIASLHECILLPENHHSLAAMRRPRMSISERRPGIIKVIETTTAPGPGSIYDKTMNGMDDMTRKSSITGTQTEIRRFSSANWVIGTSEDLPTATDGTEFELVEENSELSVVDASTSMPDIRSVNFTKLPPSTQHLLLSQQITDSEGVDASTSMPDMQVFSKSPHAIVSNKVQQSARYYTVQEVIESVESLVDVSTSTGEIRSNIYANQVRWRQDAVITNKRYPNGPNIIQEKESQVSMVDAFTNMPTHPSYRSAAQRRMNSEGTMTYPLDSDDGEDSSDTTMEGIFYQTPYCR